MGHEAAVTLCSQSEDGYLYTLEFTLFLHLVQSPMGFCHSHLDWVLPLPLQKLFRKTLKALFSCWI